MRTSTSLRRPGAVPIHWATFRLAPHPWSEPAERQLAAAGQGVAVAMPKPGRVEPGLQCNHDRPMVAGLTR